MGYVAEKRIKGHIPLYRALKGRKHLYTTDKKFYGRIAKRDQSGAICYISKTENDNHRALCGLSESCSKGRFPKEDLKTRAHFLTTSSVEKKKLLKTGIYQDFGIFGYVRKRKSPDHVPLFCASNESIPDWIYAARLDDIESLLDPIDGKKTRDILRTHLGKYCRGVRYYFADDYYRSPSLATAREIVEKSGVCKRRYLSQKHDCDDFALLMKGAFIRDVYQDGDRVYPHAMGMVWAKKPAHAMNVIIVDKQLGKSRRRRSDRFGVYIIEPQTGVFYRPEQGMLDEIYMIMM